MDSTPQHNLEAEKALLGCAIADEMYSQHKTVLAELTSKIQTGHFYKTSHQQLYRLMLDLYTHEKPINLISIGEEISSKKLDLSIADVAEIADMPTSGGWEYYSDIVLDKYTRRQLRCASAQIQMLAENGELPIAEAIGQAQQIICDSTSFEVRENTFDMKSMFELLAEKIMTRKPDHRTGLATGFTNLDSYINGGLRPGDYGIIGARPSMGKTALTLAILLNIAKRKKPVHFFSLEMSKEKLYERMISSVTRIPHNKIVTGNLTPEEERARDNALIWMTGLPIIITENVNDISQIWAIARKNKMLKKTEFIAVDYLQIINSPLGAKASENDSLTAISKALKNMATSLNVSVFALSQLNRSVEGRVNKVPTLSDLRGSGSLEQDADHIWLLYRDEYYKPSTEKKGIVEVHIAKQRDGARGLSAQIYFKKQNGSFCDLSQQSDNTLRDRL